MEVILLERVEKLGAIGDVVKVKDGFARNYLLPRKKALRANDSNRKLFETNRARIEEENAERRSDAEKDAKGVDGKTVQLIRQASNTGQLYGSVSARDIVDALAARFEQLAVAVVGAQRLLVGQQVIAGKAVLDLYHVADGAELFDALKQNDFHGSSSLFHDVRKQADVAGALDRAGQFTLLLG